MNGQFSEELRLVESVLRGMIEKRAIDPSIQGFAGHFLEEEEPRGFEDTPNLGYTGLPVHHMMQHSEIEDRIEVFIGKGKLLDTPHRQNNAALRCTCKSLLRAANLLGVEVDSVDLACSELLQQYLHSHTAAASDVENACVVKPTSQFLQQRTLIETLHERPHWIVDKELFRKVQFHAQPLVIRKQRTNGVIPSSRSTVRPASWASRSHSSLE